MAVWVVVLISENLAFERSVVMRASPWMIHEPLKWSFSPFKISETTTRVATSSDISWSCSTVGPAEVMVVGMGSRNSFLRR